MKMKKHGLIAIVMLLLGTQLVKAHCPLCTIGAVAAAGGAAYLGVNSVVIGLFLGAFAVSVGWWVANLIKKQFFRFQKIAIIIFSFITTIIPIKPLLSDYAGIYISWIGQYGTTFAIDLFLIGSLVGGFITSITPWLSKKITKSRNGKFIPYQGMILTLSLLIIFGVILQLIS